MIFEDKGKIHIRKDRDKITFEDVHELMDYIQEWQQFAIFEMMRLDHFPNEAWTAFAEANRN